MKNFDEKLDEIRKNLILREEIGAKRHMAETHGDYIKQCVEGGKVKVLWITTKNNSADIMKKPLPLDTLNISEIKYLI